MRYLFVARFPNDLARLFIQAEHRLALSTAADEDEITIDRYRSGAFPANVAAVVLVHQVAAPNLFAVGTVETVDHEVGCEQIDFTIAYRGRGTRPVAPASRVAAAIE